MLDLWAPFKVVRITLVIALAVIVPSSSGQIKPDGTWDPPDPAIKQLWFQKNTSKTAFVFVHGLNSDNTCWLYEEDGHPKQYWPYLVAVDERLHHPSVFLGGYNFGEHYNLFNAVVELIRGMTRDGVITYPNILFIAHSMGGVVVRRMLCNFSDRFRGKNVGILLFGSPTTGSKVADIFSFLHSSEIDRLRTDSIYLRDLDQEFKNLMDGYDHAPADRVHIMGAEVAEGNDYNGVMQIVEWQSATRNFAYQTLPGDHSSIVRPSSLSSPSHEFLVEFYEHFASSFKVQSEVPIAQHTDTDHRSVFSYTPHFGPGVGQDHPDPPPPAPPAVPTGPTQGVLHCSGVPIPWHGRVIFDHLPLEPLRFDWDHSAWQLMVQRQPNGNKQAVLTSLRPGIQTNCEIRWEKQ